MCDAPLSIRYDPPIPDGKGGFIYWFPADCGKCLKCLTKRKAQWSYRLVEELRNSFSSYFVTLTYDDKNVPHGDDTLTINKQDHKDFIKNLKKYETPTHLKKRKEISIEELERKKRKVREIGKLKYYAAYEYGDKFSRPHGHYILYNVRDINNIALSWGKGRIDIDPDVNVNNIDYTLKYMVKDHTNIDYENKQKEVSFKSKGLGLNAADDSFIRSISKTEVNQLVNLRGAKIAIPRYYRKKFIDDSTALKKSQYISEVVNAKRLREEQGAEKWGFNIYQQEVNGKKVRKHLLESRQKRNVE